MNRNVLAVCTHRWLGIVWVGLLAAILTVAIGCGGDDGLGDCPPASQSQQNTGATIVFTTCIGCHSSQLQGADRRGVPDGMDFDVIDIVRDMAADIYRTAEDGSMPPPTSDVTALNSAQVEAVRVYLACGAEFGPPSQ
ncbi:MAG: cytochrome c [Proteobacteria bacterium]|nr:cytochrome c [Pseudomonadota bacterium]